MENQRLSILPYLQLNITGAGGGTENDFLLNPNAVNENAFNTGRLHCKFKNIGRDSAVNIECNLLNRSGRGEQGIKNAFYTNRALAKDEETNDINLVITTEENILNKFRLAVDFDDLMGNSYNQDFVIEMDGKFDFGKVRYYSNGPILKEPLQSNIKTSHNQSI